MVSNHLKQHKGLLANYGAVIICGIGGFALPICVGIFYPPQALGVFNQTFSLYVVLSQVGALGIHLSVLKHVAQHSHSQEAQQQTISSGLAATVIIALATSTVVWLADTGIGAVLNSTEIEKAIRWVALGLFFFAINKTLLAALNSLERLEEYASYTSLRFVFMFVAMAVLILAKADAANLSAILPLAEIPLFILLLRALRSFIAARNISAGQIRQHVSFGLRAAGGHVMLDLNSRVDILCLGLFLDDRSIGLYSMAAILAEGACQLPLVLRTVYNPKVVRQLHSKDRATLPSFIKKIRNITWISMLAISALSVYAYPFVIPLLTGNQDYAQGQMVFAILMAGVCIASGYLPFGLMLVNGGYPERQTVMVMLLLGINVAGNLLLIPACGPYGAAIATFLSYAASVVLLRALTKKHLGITI